MDCLEGMKQIPDGTIDAVICDLPYGVLNTDNKETSWDSVIPFDKLWEQYLRICKPTAPIILFGQGMFTSDLMQSNRKMWRYNLIWYKPGQPAGFMNAPYRPLRNHEDIVMFYKKQPTYNPQFTKGDKSHPRGGGNHKQDVFDLMHRRVLFRFRVMASSLTSPLRQAST